MTLWIPQDSPLYPLPEDYKELSVGGQRKARVNACRLWTVKDKNSKEISEAFAAGLRFFDM